MNIHQLIRQPEKQNPLIPSLRNIEIILFVALKINLSICSFNNGSINLYDRLTKTSKHAILTSSLSDKTKSLLQDKVMAMVGGAASEVSKTERVVPVQLLQRALQPSGAVGRAWLSVLIDARFVQVPIGFSFHN